MALSSVQRPVYAPAEGPRPEDLALQRAAGLTRWGASYVLTAPIGVCAGLVYLARVRRAGYLPRDHAANVFTLETCAWISLALAGLAAFALR